MDQPAAPPKKARPPGPAKPPKAHCRGTRIPHSHAPGRRSQAARRTPHSDVCRDPLTRPALTHRVRRERERTGVLPPALSSPCTDRVLGDRTVHDALPAVRNCKARLPARLRRRLRGLCGVTARTLPNTAVLSASCACSTPDRPVMHDA
ncbi:hypothetical protein OH76DRAFT_454006 [Lentinus brumalis]|uniref:Uncharacterized protein n=1 Tax=Lentinus brumalis TaxID=2498619 RepID=A0A371DDA8_9APHY|nr:hypothetical protein OH76DRAFT_454006 [Polyporus brumalis]